MDAGVLASVLALIWYGESWTQSHGWIRSEAYQLGIELRKARLAGIIEDKYGVDHDPGQVGLQPFSKFVISRRSLEHRSMSSESFQLLCDVNAEM